MIAQDSGHVARAVSRIIQQYQGKPRIQAFVEALLTQIQEIEDAYEGIRLARDKDTATGVNLDQAGAEAGAIRSGFDDADFRTVINATILANWSDGEESDLTSILKAFYGAGADLTLVEFGQLHSIYYLADYPLLWEPRFVASLLTKAKQAGTRVFVHYVTHATQPFQLSSQPATSEFGNDGLADIGFTLGGRLSGVEAA